MSDSVTALEFLPGTIDASIANADRGFCATSNVSDGKGTPQRPRSPDDSVISKGVGANTVESPCRAVAQAGASSGNTHVNGKSCQCVPRSVDDLEIIRMIG